MSVLRITLTEDHIKLLKHLKWSVNDKGFIVGTENEEEDPAPFGENNLYEAIDQVNALDVYKLGDSATVAFTLRGNEY